MSHLTRILPVVLALVTLTPLPQAGLAWTGDAGNGQKAAVWQLQWDNPHPEKVIRSVGLSYGPDKQRWGAPVLLGITAGRVRD